MAGKVGARKFTDDDKAQMLVALAANDGNVKKTARELGVSAVTLRRYRDQHKRGQQPVSDETLDAAREDFLTKAASVRDAALSLLEEKIDEGSMSGRDLITAVGVLDDKIARANAANSTPTDGGNALPPPDQLRALMAGAVEGAIAAAERRDREIVEAEVVRELPA